MKGLELMKNIFYLYTVSADVLNGRSTYGSRYER